MATTTTHSIYGTQPDIRVERGIASKYKKRNGLAYPLVGEFKKVTGSPAVLQNNTSEGGYFSKSYGLSLIKNNLRQLLLCNKGERVMLPSYGASLDKFLFEPLDETTFMLIKEHVLGVLETYFGIVKVLSIGVFGEPADRNQIVVSLTLQLLDESLDIFDIEVTIA